MLSLLSPPPPGTPRDAAPHGALRPPLSLCVPPPQHPPSTHHLSGSAVLSRAARLTLRRQIIITTRCKKWLFCPKKGAEGPRSGGLGGGRPSSTAHLGTSRAGLTLGTIQTTEALGGRGGGSAAVGRVLGYRGGVPDLGALPAHPTSRGCIGGGMWHSLCVPSCPADRQFRGAHVRPTRKGLVVTQSHEGGVGGVPHPILCVLCMRWVPPPWGKPHLGAGGAAFARTAGFASFTLWRRTRLVAQPHSVEPPGGGSANRQGGGGPTLCHLHHRRSCQGGQRGRGGPWVPTR